MLWNGLLRMEIKNYNIMPTFHMTTTEKSIQNDSNNMEQLESESLKPQKELIDDSFYVEQTRWKTWNSYDVNNKCIITSLTEEQCVKATRFYLKQKQEGFDTDNQITYSGTVGGKL
jgi:hypothetical protein